MVEKIQAFYSQVSGMERYLHELHDRGFDDSRGTMRMVMSVLGKMERYFEIRYSGSTFSYRLKHNARQARTNRMGFFILSTKTILGAHEVLNMYRQKYVLEKVFMHSKQNMVPLYARTERGTRARVFLSIYEE